MIAQALLTIKTKATMFLQITFLETYILKLEDDYYLISHFEFNYMKLIFRCKTEIIHNAHKNTMFNVYLTFILQEVI